jgi:hypothetical protein
MTSQSKAHGRLLALEDCLRDEPDWRGLTPLQRVNNLSGTNN